MVLKEGHHSSLYLLLPQTDNDWASELMATAAVDRSSSSSNLDRGEQRAGVGVSTGLEKCEDGYIENDRVLVLYGKGKTQRLYEAKVISVEVTDGKKDYLVHYSGWNNRYNEWIDNNRIMGKIVGPYKSRPYFNKVRKGECVVFVTTGLSVYSGYLFLNS